MNLSSLNTKNLSYGKELAKRKNVNKRFKSYTQSNSISFKGGHNLDVYQAVSQTPKIGFWSKCKKFFKQILSHFRFKKRNLQTVERDNNPTSNNQNRVFNSLNEALSCLNLDGVQIDGKKIGLLLNENQNINKELFVAVVEKLKGKEDKSAMSFVLKTLCSHLDKSLIIKNFDKDMDISEDNIDQLLDNIAIETQEVKPEAKQEVKQDAKYELEMQIKNLSTKIDESDECNDDDFKSISKIIQEFGSIKNIDEDLSAKFLKLLNIVIDIVPIDENYKILTLIDGLIQNISKMKFNNEGVKNLCKILNFISCDKILCPDKCKSLIDKCNEIDIESCNECQKGTFNLRKDELIDTYFYSVFDNKFKVKKNKTQEDMYAVRKAFAYILTYKKNNSHLVELFKDAFYYKLLTSQNKDLLIDFINNNNININEILSKVLLPNDVNGTKFEKIIEPANQEKYNKLKCSMSLSDEYLFKQLFLDDVSLYKNEYLQIIRNIDFSTNHCDVKLSNEQRIEILKDLYGEEFVNFYYDEINSQIQKIDGIEKKTNEQSIQNEINKNQDVILRRQKTIVYYMDLFDSVYDELMNVTGLSYLKDNKTIKFKIAPEEKRPWAAAFYSELDQSINLSKYRFDFLNKYYDDSESEQYLQDSKSIYLHELTHYIQDLLTKVNPNDLSSGGQGIINFIRDDINKYDTTLLTYEENYSKDTKEIGAHMTQFFDAIEKRCGKKYGEYFIQEESTDESRNVQAKKIVGALRENGIIKNTFDSIEMEKKRCPNVSFWYILLDNIITKYNLRLMFEDIMNAKGIKNDDLTENEEKCCKNLETIFSEALKYLISKEDMLVINRNLSQK